ncbi:MAG: HAD-IIB family hydrolase [Candidatus Dormibacteria bacterium]
MTTDSRSLPGLPDIVDAVLPDTVGMLVLDLDGTCLDHRQQLHPRIAAAVREAAAQVPVVIATGRMYRSALPWARKLGISSPLLCYQGAWAEEVGPGGANHGRVLFRDELPVSVARSALAVARRNGWHRIAFHDDRAFVEQARVEGEIYSRISGVDLEQCDDLNLEVRDGSTKMVCVIEDPAEVRRCRSLLESTLGETANVTRSLPQYIEVTSPSATKARALDRLRLELAVRGPVVAVGDAPNDASMLEAADVAVAVRVRGGEADAELAGHADCTCAPPEDAGVADLLRQLGLTDT